MAPKRGQVSSSGGSGTHSETFGFSIKRWKPSLRHNEPIPILFRPEQHVSTSARQREYPRVPTSRGNYAGTLAWWRCLLPATRTLVQNAGFGAFINLLDGEGTPTLLACLSERWWDTTHTFHLAGRELTMTPYEFYRISGLRIGGRIVEIHSVDSAGDFSARVLHRRYADTISYPSLAEDFGDAPQDTAEERTIMAQAFILYLFGAQIFPNAGQSVSVFFLTLLEDLSQVSEYAWGSAALAFLYANMDALSRGASSLTAGYWRAWTVWARRLLFHNASIDLSASHVVRSHIDNLTWGEVYTHPWYRAESLAPAAWDEEALDKSFFSHLMECLGARAFYLAERVTPQLQSGLDMPVPIDPPPHMLFPFRIPDGLLESWREGTIYHNHFSWDDEYRFFAARHLMPPLGAPAPVAALAHEAPPSPHAVDPIFPPWIMTAYQSPHDIIEVPIPRSTVVYGYPFAPGTRQVTNPEAEGLVQMIGNLKSEFTRMSLRACNAEATQERGGQQGGDGEDGDTSSRAPSRSFKGHIFGSGFGRQGSLRCHFVLEHELVVEGARLFDMDACYQVLILARRISGMGGIHMLNKINLIYPHENEDIQLPPSTGAVKDLRVSPCGRLTLLASLGKKLSILSMGSNNVVLTYDLPGPAWSCSWDLNCPHYIYAGLQELAVTEQAAAVTVSSGYGFLHDQI